MSLFEGQRHWNVGDLVTIILAETTQASRTAGLSADRAASNDVLNTADMAGKVLAQGGFIGALKKDGGNIAHEASGSASQAASLQGSITASVVEVLPNGNLVVTGEKQLALSEGSEFIQVTGVIRAQDIQPDNTVASRRIANAQISYRGTGELARAAKPGWGTSLLYNLWPF
jgi:flagellar L-ring protein precursor FlgH